MSHSPEGSGGISSLSHFCKARGSGHRTYLAEEEVSGMWLVGGRGSVEEKTAALRACVDEGTPGGAHIVGK